jgi:hypothetical protein
VDELVDEYVDQNIIYTDRAFEFEFMEIHVSDRDCFHPSALGQKVLSRKTWQEVKNEF